jgi:hypothetical protein
MKIKVTKVFAKFIESNCPKLSAEVVEMSANSYGYNVGSIFDAGDDYDPATGKFKAIRVNYPPEWYASPRYISTAQILEEFHRNNVTTAAGLVDMLNNWLQI